MICFILRQLVSNLECDFSSHEASGSSRIFFLDDLCRQVEVKESAAPTEQSKTERPEEQVDEITASTITDEKATTVVETTGLICKA